MDWSKAYHGKSEADREIERKALLVDLTPAARVATQDWLGLGPGWDLSSLFAKPASVAQTTLMKKNPDTVARYGDVLFQVPHRPLVLSVPEAR